MSSIFPEVSESMGDWAVKVSSIGIRFFLPAKDGTGRRKEEFWALREISFEVKKGEVFGIIGSNGSGKSTLLKIIAGIYPATEGRAEVRGNVAPLIELGAAFNPELSGAENIYLAGSIYRIPRKVVREQFGRIVDFSGLRKFIHSPVKNYSSGMFLRLAFSIIVFFKPDVVLIDEIIAVGDRVFQQKSFEKILSFIKAGASLVVVSHDMNLIKQLCHRVAILSRGKLCFLGHPEEAVNYYLELLKRREGLEEIAAGQNMMAEQPLMSDSRRWGNRAVEITGVEFVDEAGKPKESFRTGDYFEARISYINHHADSRPVFGVAIYTIYRMLLYGPNTLENELEMVPSSLAREDEKELEGERGEKGKVPARGTVRFIVDSLPLLEGDYLFSASVYDASLTVAYDHHEMMYLFRVKSLGGADFGPVRLDCRWAIAPE